VIILNSYVDTLIFHHEDYTKDTSRRTLH